MTEIQTKPDASARADELELDEPVPTSWRNVYCGLGITVVILGVLALAGAAWIMGHPGLWRAWSDGRGIYVRAGAPGLRPVMWAPPEPLAAAGLAGPNLAQGALAPRGTTLVFAAKAPDGDDLDLYTCRFDGVGWSKPEPIVFINTNADELGPTITADGRAMFFSSDRKGGMGGLDIYVSWWNGQRWTQAFNLGSKVNSEFDELDPCLSPARDTLYFASNRPRNVQTLAERKAHWAKTVGARALGDLDIYAAGGVSVPSRKNPLRDAAFRKAMIAQLGGSPETEAAVLKALTWLTKNQETDGHWDMAKHGGGKGQDIAGTALAVLSYLGYGVQYTEKSEFQEPVYRAVRWLKGKAIQYDGNFSRGASQGMYGHGMATIALAESYAVTKDRTLREPLEKAVQVIVKAQNTQTGGWRYDSKPPPRGDLSVTGWQVMALYSARNAGIDVPEASMALARKWMQSVAAADGSYGYQQAKKHSPAMAAEGMFVQQLLGARRAEARQKKTADWMMSYLPGRGGADFYCWYYGCLSLYQQQGPQWTKWNNAIKPTLLKLQDESGTWTPSRWKPFGKVGASAMGALCLEVYYRYMWRLDQEADPVVEANKKLGRSPIEFPAAPADLLAGHVAKLSSPGVDRSPRFSARGDWLYLASDRSGGLGGMDVYRTRVTDGGEFEGLANAGPIVNTSADDAAPSTACHGSLLLVTSNRPGPDGAPAPRLYTHVARELRLVKAGWQLDVAEWWLLGLLLGLAALAVIVISKIAWGRRSRRAGTVAWVFSYLVLLTMAGISGLALWVYANPGPWRAFTDGAGLKVPDGDEALRYAIWDERPTQLDSEINRRPNVLSLAASPRGALIVFSRQLPTEERADLFLMRREAGRWSAAEPIAELNTPSDEKSPALSADGTILLFHSDRPGGRGGQDVYLSRWTGKAWAPAVNLGPAVNTAADECDPCLAPGEKGLYFASNRAPGGGGDKGAVFDIYHVELPGAAGPQPAKTPPAGTQPAAPTASRVAALSSGGNDRSPTFTRHGDFAYVSSDRPGGSGGMDLYRSRVLDGKIGPALAAGPRVNTSADDLSPAATCQGFELLLTSDRVFNQRQSLLLYELPAWEVSAVDDYEAFQWMQRSKWWLVALVGGLLLLIALIIWYIKWGQYGRWGALTRCMLLSLLLHAVLLIALSIWMIRQEIQKGSDGPLEIAVDANALASERLAQDIRESVNEMPNTREMVYIDSAVPYQDLPDYKPVNTKARTIVESEFAVQSANVRTEVQDVKIAEKFQLPQPQPVAQKKVSLRFQPTDLNLEERPPEAKVAEKASKPVEVAIDPVKTIDRISRAATEIRESSGTPEERGSKMAEGALPRADGSQNVTVATALAPARALPQLRGPGERLSKRIPPMPIAPDTRLGGGPGEGAGRGTGADRLDPYIGRRNKEALSRLGGGGDDTERAIARALEWFTRNQEPDGRWDLGKHGGQKGHDNAATGFAMLCYFGWNIKHTQDDKYGYRPVMKKAVDWLVGRVGKDGDLTGGQHNGMYDQGIATMALAEAYGLTKDPALKEPLERAVKFILKAQNTRLGGWRYRPGSNDCDTSVVGWQVMALTSARMAGIDVPEKSLQLAGEWLTRVSSGPHKGRYGYQTGRASETMTAESMFCRQILGTPRTDDRQAGSVEFLRNKLPNPRAVNYYYWYYAALALHQHQGETWRQWNAKMKEVLLKSQLTSGDEAGSWPDSGQWTKGNKGGKIMATAMSALSLEVYYRYLPMYGISEPPPSRHQDE